LLAALTTEGVRASMMIESPTDGDVFLAYVEQVLCPRLEPGHLVILDNLAAHKLAAVRQLIESRARKCCTFRRIRPTSTPSSRPGRS
jgi:transposase